MALFKGSDRPIKDGEAVKSSIANRPHRDLRNDVNFLKARLDAIEAGKALVITEQTFASGLVIGMPVYLDSNNIWQAGIVKLASNSGSTLFELTETSRVMGMVLTKDTNTLGSIVIQGEVEFDSSLENLIDGLIVEGVYHLSGSNAGHITASKTVVPVRVCIVNGPDVSGNYRVFVNPDQRVHTDNHGHYFIELIDAPSGEPNCVPGRPGFLWGELEVGGPYPGIIHVVVNPDPDIPGWLPADHATFDGLTKPLGAKFGYNIEADTNMREVWPPLPVDQAYIAVDGVGESGDKVIVNTDGIWWMDDTYGNAPWPVNLPCSSSESLSDSSSSPDEGFPLFPVRIEAWFTKVVHGTSLAGILELIETGLGYQTAIEPILSTNVTTEAVAGTDAVTLALPVGEDAEVTYKLPVRIFQTMFGRRPSLSLGFIVSVVIPEDPEESSSPGGSALPLNAQIAIAFSNMNLTVSRLKNPLPGELKELVTADLEPSTLDWAVFPELFEGESGKEFYFLIESVPLALDSGEVLYIKLTWRGTNTEVGARIFTVRPTVTVLNA